MIRSIPAAWSPLLSWLNMKFSEYNKHPTNQDLVSANGCRVPLLPSIETYLYGDLVVHEAKLKPHRQTEN